jgi:hypothetical protein
MTFHERPLRAEPTEHGHELLRLIATLRGLDREAVYDEAANEQACAATDDVADKILARPVASLPDVADRLILAAYWSGPELIAGHDQMSQLLDGLLSPIAGVQVEQCRLR